MGYVLTNQIPEYTSETLTAYLWWVVLQQKGHPDLGMKSSRISEVGKCF